MNRSDDMHFVNAAKAFGIPLNDVTPKQRQLAKQCAFGTQSVEEALRNLRMVLGFAKLCEDRGPEEG